MLSLPTRWGLFFASWLPTWGIWGLFALAAHSSWSVVFALMTGIGLMAMVAFFQDIVPNQPKIVGKVRSVSRADHNLHPYAAWYLLPFLIFPAQGWMQTIIAVWIVCFVGLLYVRGNCITLNPPLLLLGFHFYDVRLEGNCHSSLLLARRSVCVGMELQMAEVGDLLIIM